MTTDNFLMHDDEVLGRVRALVRALIEDQVAAPAISYSLTYIAAEFGFYAADDARKVIPVILSAVSRATAADIPTGKEEQAPAGETCEQCAPESATVH